MQNWNIMCENSGSSFGVNASCDGSDPVAVLMTAVLKIATATASKSICFFLWLFQRQCWIVLRSSRDPPS